jgi:tRNA G10  N-methylase Trm11
MKTAKKYPAATLQLVEVHTFHKIFSYWLSISPKKHQFSYSQWLLHKTIYRYIRISRRIK